MKPQRIKNNIQDIIETVRTKKIERPELPSISTIMHASADAIKTSFNTWREVPAFGLFAGTLATVMSEQLLLELVPAIKPTMELIVENPTWFHNLTTSTVKGALELGSVMLLGNALLLYTSMFAGAHDYIAEHINQRKN